MMSQISSDVVDAGPITPFAGRKLKFNTNIDASSFCKRQETNADYLATSFEDMEAQQVQDCFFPFLFFNFFISPWQLMSVIFAVQIEVSAGRKGYWVGWGSTFCTPAPLLGTASMIQFNKTCRLVTFHNHPRVCSWILGNSGFERTCPVIANPKHKHLVFCDLGW